MTRDDVCAFVRASRAVIEFQEWSHLFHCRVVILSCYKQKRFASFEMTAVVKWWTAVTISQRNRLEFWIMDSWGKRNLSQKCGSLSETLKSLCELLETFESCALLFIPRIIQSKREMLQMTKL